MTNKIYDTRIKEITDLLPPVALIEKYPCTEKSANTVLKARAAIHDIMTGKDDRLVVITGPCSIHDTKAALEYAERLCPLRERYKDSLEIIMRVYFEKPRTTESQVHRELASGVSAPVGFKNGTDGTVKVAIDALKSAAAQHTFLSVTKFGHSAIVKTLGNDDCHIILRGGSRGPNYDAANVQSAVDGLAKAGLPAKVMVDFSHANSHKEFKRQMDVCADVCCQLAAGQQGIFGVMIESHLVEGRQDLKEGCSDQLVYGQSITDACIGWEDTTTALEKLALAVQARRAAAK